MTAPDEAPSAGADIPSYVVVREVWAQCSADLDTVRNFATLIVGPDTTVAEIMAWAKKHHAITLGPIVLAESAP